MLGGTCIRRGGAGEGLARGGGGGGAGGEGGAGRKGGGGGEGHGRHRHCKSLRSFVRVCNMRPRERASARKLSLVFG